MTAGRDFHPTPQRLALFDCFRFAPYGSDAVTRQTGQPTRPRIRVTSISIVTRSGRSFGVR
jgi:hypothetical protein